MPWQSRAPVPTTEGIEAIHRRTLEEAASLKQTIARLETEIAQARIARQTATVKAQRLGELMAELSGMKGTPGSVEQSRATAIPADAEPAGAPLKPTRKGYWIAGIVVAILAAGALLASQTLNGNDWQGFFGHAAASIHSGFVSSR